MNKKGPQNISPIDWYLGSYISRFIEIEDVDIGNQEKMFSAWENTVIVQADSLKKAYEKIEIIGKDHAEPYTNVDQKSVQWEYLGITEVIPIYEDLEDGAEIAWTSHNPKKLKNLKSRVKSLEELYQ